MSQINPAIGDLFAARHLRLAQALLGFARTMMAQAQSRDYPQVLVALDAELPNIAAALDALTRDRPAEGLALARELYLAMQEHFGLRGLTDEQLAWASALNDWDLAETGKVDVRVMNSLGNVYHERGEYQAALGIYTHMAQAIAHDPSKRRTLARVYNNLGLVYKRLEQLDDAADYLTQAIQLEEMHGDAHRVPAQLMNLAQIRGRQDRHDESAELTRQAIGLAEVTGQHLLRAQFTGMLAKHLMMLRDFDAAEPLYQQALARLADIHDEAGVAATQFNYALLCYMTRQGEKAHRLIVECIATFERLGHPETPSAYDLLEKIKALYPDIRALYEA